MTRPALENFPWPDSGHVAQMEKAASPDVSTMLDCLLTFWFLASFQRVVHSPPVVTLCGLPCAAEAYMADHRGQGFPPDIPTWVTRCTVSLPLAGCPIHVSAASRGASRILIVSPEPRVFGTPSKVPCPPAKLAAALQKANSLSPQSRLHTLFRRG